MPHLSQSEYVAEARQIEAVQTEAQRRRDLAALAFIQQRKANLNRAFWGRDMKPGSGR